MKFDVWTFAFQVINFIVLLFILKRILYKPVREIIEKRRGLIHQNIEDAEKTKKEALELKERYQQEMDKLKEFKSQMLEKLHEEVEEERKKLMSKAKEEADEVIEKERVLFDREKGRLESELKDKAVETVSIFASNLLTNLSDENLHRAVYGRLFKEIQQIATTMPAGKEKDGPLTIDLITAYPSNENEIREIQEAIESLISHKVFLNTIIDKSLIAGAKIKVYDMIYDASLSGQINALMLKLKETL
jgi:F-type H+-transporting ATPase subunit b